MAIFEQPSTEAELWDVLYRHADAVPLAGGTDLLVRLHAGKQRPECVVDIKRVSAFMKIGSQQGHERIGAAASCRDIAISFAEKSGFEAMVGVCQLIGSRQIQNRATFGGNVCNASPAADAVPLLMAMEARYNLVSREGTRSVPAEDFATGPGRTVLGSGELLESIDLPPRSAGTGDAYLRVTPRTEMDIAIASAGVRVCVDDDGRCTGARVAIGGVAPRALLVQEAADMLVGSTLNAEALNEFVARVREEANPIDDVRGTRHYRRHVIGVLAWRAALTARERALAGRN